MRKIFPEIKAIIPRRSVSCTIIFIITLFGIPISFIIDISFIFSRVIVYMIRAIIIVETKIRIPVNKPICFAALSIRFFPKISSCSFLYKHFYVSTLLYFLQLHLCYIHLLDLLLLHLP